MSVSDEWVIKGKRHMKASVKLAPIAFAVSGSSTVTCSRGQSLFPSARSSGRGSM